MRRQLKSDLFLIIDKGWYAQYLLSLFSEVVDLFVKQKFDAVLKFRSQLNHLGI